MAPLTWIELESWKRLFKEELPDDLWVLSFWELSLIKDLSYAYCAELGAATDKKREAPYKEAVLDRTDVSKRMYSIFMGLKLKKN